MRLCDLGLTIEGSALEERIGQLNLELERRGMRFRPYFWLSEDWFTPNGIPGCAIPFYLAHPRLIRLERSMMLQVEGGAHEWCMKLLRHEAGHALDHAYTLHRRRTWKQRFGRSSKPYPEVYRPRPYSKGYVVHLDDWYAQSHPDEDFAETFAVWLHQPRAGWHKRYQGWSALEKLEYVDELMREIVDQKPPVTTKARFEDLSESRKTLRQYYEDKQYEYESMYPDVYDRDLLRLFSDAPGDRNREPAAGFLRRVRREVLTMVSRWTGEYEYTLDLVMREMMGRCKELKLRVRGAERQAKLDFSILLTKHTMNSLYSRGRRVYV